jgi:hypothetical protein
MCLEDDMAEQPVLDYRILPNSGAGWYWEVTTQDREVIAIGLAATHAQARIEVMRAGLDRRPLDSLTGS